MQLEFLNDVMIRVINATTFSFSCINTSLGPLRFFFSLSAALFAYNDNFGRGFLTED